MEGCRTDHRRCHSVDPAVVEILAIGQQAGATGAASETMWVRPLSSQPAISHSRPGLAGKACSRPTASGLARIVRAQAVITTHLPAVDSGLRLPTDSPLFETTARDRLISGRRESHAHG